MQCFERSVDRIRLGQCVPEAEQVHWTLAGDTVSRRGSTASTQACQYAAMNIDLSTVYLGIKLDSPLIASSCPLTGDLVSLQILEKAGVSAAVLPSLFEEQIGHEMSDRSDCNLGTYNTGPDEYLQLIRSAKHTLGIPIIASLNGATEGGWVHHANLMQEAGADAVELNIYLVPTDTAVKARDIERQYCDLVAAVCEQLHIPLAVKIGSHFSAVPHFANELLKAGAEGLVLFNRFLAPDIDLDSMTFNPDLKLSRPEELGVALRWIAILRDQVGASLAATGGVHDADDVAKALLVGSDAVMIASALLRHGPRHIRSIRGGLENWMTRHQYASLDQLKGSMSLQNCTNPEGLTRANYLKAVTSYSRPGG